MRALAMRRLAVFSVVIGVCIGLAGVGGSANAYGTSLCPGAQPYNTCSPGIPYSETTATTNITRSSATLNGTLTTTRTEGLNCYFEYGPAPAYGVQTPMFSVPPNTEETPAVTVTGLTPQTTYDDVLQCAIPGLSYGMGNNIIFSTLAAASSAVSGPAAQAPTTTTGHAGRLTRTSALLRGGVSPQSQATTCAFEYGTSSYSRRTKSHRIAASTRVVAVSATVHGLRAGRLYHYRLRCANATGVSIAPARTLHTHHRS